MSGWETTGGDAWGTNDASGGNTGAGDDPWNNPQGGDGGDGDGERGACFNCGQNG